ncbi:hypothetical protein SAMN05443579_11598 [Variovorax sp. PDC80]|uniref:DUF6361 family protein n=1 Tax=Variovorax sp. PDC80 TaxID=1882827 RepID=UPI0008DF1410|nr:DUF6361 family protein [Variovorax sp. PDC80]SFP78079.1 hypothetical protein SAMN05443579_11598 [Variovorax sp. PDC80]
MTTAASRWEWLDFDEDESRQIRDFLSQQAEGEGVDPLRIGASVRDRMADTLFPGTSTQYTRLRYVILAPALLSKRGVTLEGLEGSQAALNTAIDLANRSEKGVIGRRKRERDFVRLYWTAIGEWKLLTSVGGDRRDVTVENGWEAFRFSGRADEDGSPLSEARVRWDPKVVKLAGDFWKRKDSKSPNIQCTKAEVDYLLDRWLALAKEPALAALASQVKAGRVVSKAAYPWDVAMTDHARARDDLQRAKAISMVCWTAQLAYNCALVGRARKLEADSAEAAWQKKAGQLDAMQEKLDKLLGDWQKAVVAELSDLGPWTKEETWEPLGDRSARRFLAACAQRLVDGKRDLTSRNWADSVRKRENSVNPAPKLAHATHLATWSGTPEMANRWDFRWKACVKAFMFDAENPHG